MEDGIGRLEVERVELDHSTEPAGRVDDEVSVPRDKLAFTSSGTMEARLSGSAPSTWIVMKLIIIIGSSRIRSGLDDDARERPLLAWMCAVRGAYGRSAAICQSCIHAESTGSSGGLACQAGLGERIEMGAM